MAGFVFISYSHADAAYVARLKVRLAVAGLDVWTDGRLAGGDIWSDVIEKRIRDCAVFVVVMSSQAAARQEVQREIRRALELAKPVVPILLEGRPFENVAQIHYDDVRGGGMPSPGCISKLMELTGVPTPPPLGGLGRVIGAHDGPVKAVSFSADSRLLATGGEDEKVCIWDTMTGAHVRTIGSELAPCWPLVFLPGRSDLIAAASYDAPGVHIFDVTSGAFGFSLAEDQTFGDEIYDLVFSADGSLLATGDPDGAVIWRVDTNQKVGKLAAGNSRPRWPLAFSKGDMHLVVSHEAVASGPVGIWNPRTLELEHRLTKHSDLVTSAAYSPPDGTLLVTGSYDGTARIWDATGAVLSLLKHDGAINDVAFSRDGAHVFTAGMDRCICVWEVATGEFVRDLRHIGGVYAIDVSGDGQTLASGAGDGKVRLWRVSEIITR